MTTFDKLFHATQERANGARRQWEEPDWSILNDRRGELPEFPVEVLSGPCADWVVRAAHGAGVTVDHVAVPLLGIASSLIGTARRVMASRSWSEPLTLWTAIVGFSGTGKTPGINVTKRALALVERNRKTQIAELQRAHETKVEAAKAARDIWRNQVKQAAEGEVVSLDTFRHAKGPLRVAGGAAVSAAHRRGGRGRARDHQCAHPPGQPGGRAVP